MAKNDMRPAVAEWLTALDVNPHDVPIDSDLYITEADGTRNLHYEAFARDDEGHRIRDERGTHVVIQARTVPLTVDPPEHWQPPDAPRCDHRTA